MRVAVKVSNLKQKCQSDSENVCQSDDEMFFFLTLGGVYDEGI